MARCKISKRDADKIAKGAKHWSGHHIQIILRDAANGIGGPVAWAILAPVVQEHLIRSAVFAMIRGNARETIPMSMLDELNDLAMEAAGLIDID